jgi:hypothetical protein
MAYVLYVRPHVSPVLPVARRFQFETHDPADHRFRMAGNQDLQESAGPALIILLKPLPEENFRVLRRLTSH